MRSQLTALRAMMTDHAEDFYASLWTDLRRNRTDADLTDVAYINGEADHALSHLRDWMKPAPVSTPSMLAPSDAQVRFARSREYSAFADEVRRRANSIVDPGDIWELHDFLSRKRKAFDQKYNYRYSKLVFVFAELIVGGWLTEAELAGLDEEKLARIRWMLER